MGPTTAALMWMPLHPPVLRNLVAWHPQPLPLLPALCLAAFIAYSWGVLRLHRRGHTWPVGRWISFTGGLVTVVAVTGTALNGYAMRLFSVHMVQHMVLSMVSPLLLLMGAPVMLCLRATPSRGAGSFLRRAVVRCLHSRVLSVVTKPAVTLPLFIVSLYGLYFTPVFDAAMRTWWGHDLMLVHFLVVGLLLFWPIMAIDPSPRATSPVLRMLELFVAMPFHAFFGVIVMTSTTLLVRTFRTTPAGWGVVPVSDQQLGGGIAWAFSEIPTLLVVAVLFVQWARASDRESRRSDRAADRHDDALDAYNAWLGRLAREGSTPPRGRGVR
ncbi:cytochrome c oxidase assembly protein [Phycicoccus ginsengisoli]